VAGSVSDWQLVSGEVGGRASVRKASEAKTTATVKRKGAKGTERTQRKDFCLQTLLSSYGKSPSKISIRNKPSFLLLSPFPFFFLCVLLFAVLRAFALNF
jgi:hypothetical protein